MVKIILISKAGCSFHFFEMLRFSDGSLKRYE